MNCVGYAEGAGNEGLAVGSEVGSGVEASSVVFTGSSVTTGASDVPSSPFKAAISARS